MLRCVTFHFHSSFGTVCGKEASAPRAVRSRATCAEKPSVFSYAPLQGMEGALERTRPRQTGGGL
jgi:hypothetical protein